MNRNNKNSIINFKTIHNSLFKTRIVTWKIRNKLSHIFINLRVKLTCA